MYNPCIRSTGPRNAKIALVGEAPGETEAERGVPFVGSSGHLLNSVLAQAGIERDECFLTHVFFTRPPNNNLEAFCVEPKSPFCLTGLPSLVRGRYLHEEFRPELERLREELSALRPNLIVAMGNTALWALLKTQAISRMRGTPHASPLGKVLPTYHPSTIFRQWSLRPILTVDMIKAAREMHFPQIRRPDREIWIAPSLGDIQRFYTVHAYSAPTLAVDIETKAGQITEIGFATSSKLALVIPFSIAGYPGRSYWPTLREETSAWQWVQELLALPQPKIFQNGLYDLQYIRRMGLSVANATEDTMLLHHAMHPEMNKGLGFMGSYLTDEPSWKFMRQRGEDTLKADDE